MPEDINLFSFRDSVQDSATPPDPVDGILNEARALILNAAHEDHWVRLNALYPMTELWMLNAMLDVTLEQVAENIAVFGHAKVFLG